jgi:hypothetical protein
MLGGSPENRLTELNDPIDIAQATSLLHLWDWDIQVRLCERVIKLLCDGPGSMALSRQVGGVEAGEYPNGRVSGGTMSRLLGGCGRL